jgi:protein-S-isoprenylcysteine O-methyltransferase Ste14
VLEFVLMIAAHVAGIGALILLGAGLGGYLDLHLSASTALGWDAALSLLFFAQHSGMVRRPVKAWMARWLPSRDLGALYALASGAVLAAVVILWQRVGVFRPLHGPLHWAGLAIASVAMVLFVWGLASLRSVDFFGARPILARRRGVAEPPAAQLVVRGPYRWVRHPLYLATLLLIWSPMVFSADRLLFDLLWSCWIVIGTYLEELDLRVELGEPYAAYCRRVPMLLPWRRPARHARLAGTHRPLL